MPDPPDCIPHTTDDRIARDCDLCRRQKHHDDHHRRPGRGRRRSSSHDKKLHRERSRRQIDDGCLSGLTAEMLEVPRAVYQPGGKAAA